MNAQVQPLTEVAKSAVKPRQTYLKGLIGSRRKISTQEGARFLTLIKLPAETEYDAPSVVEVESTESLGQTGTEFSGFFKLRGYGRSFDTKDENGDKVKVFTATNILSYVG